MKKNLTDGFLVRIVGFLHVGYLELDCEENRVN